MWARLHLFATSLCYISLLHPFAAISLLYLSAVSFRRIMRLQQGAPFRWQLGARAMPPAAHGLLAARQPVRAARRCCTGCELESLVTHESQAPAAERVPHQLAQPSRKPRTLQSARPLFTIGSTLVPCPLSLGREGIRQPGGSAACVGCLALPHTATVQHG